MGNFLKAFFISTTKPGIAFVSLILHNVSIIQCYFRVVYTCICIFNFIGSDLAGETAAALAAASIVFSSINSSYSALCLTHAKQLYSFAKQYQGKYHLSITNVAGFYP